MKRVGRKNNKKLELADYDIDDLRRVRNSAGEEDLIKHNVPPVNNMETNAGAAQKPSSSQQRQQVNEVLERDPFQQLNDVDGVNTDTPIGPWEAHHLHGVAEECCDDDEQEGVHPLEKADVLTEVEFQDIVLTKLRTLKDKYENQKDDLKESYKDSKGSLLAAQHAYTETRIPLTNNPSYLVQNDELGITEEYIKKQVGLRKTQRNLLSMGKHSRTKQVLLLEATRQRNAKVKARRGAASSSRPPPAMEEPWVDVELADDDQDDEPSGVNDRTTSRFNKEVNKVKTQQQGIQVDELPICSYTTYKAGGKLISKCSEVALPCTKYCINHILEDKRQVLFKRCGREMGAAGGGTCSTPVLSIVEKLGCDVHLMPAIRDFIEDSDSQKKLAEKVSSLPVMKKDKKLYQLLENLVCDEVNNVEHMSKLIKDIKSKPLKLNTPETPDTDDSEEEDDEMNDEGKNPGPGYLTMEL